LSKVEQEKNESFIYDRSLRELFGEVPKTLIKLLINKEIKEILDISFPKVEERKVDLLTRLEDNTLFHLEIQSTDDKTMPIRMLQYTSLIYEKYKQFPKQLVLYVGNKKIKIKNGINTKELVYNYEVRDIREFDCSILIQSEDIADNIIALLCDIKDIDRFFKVLNQKLENFSPKKREDYLRKLFYLMKLRPNIHKEYKIKTKESKMPFVIDLADDPVYQEGLEEGIEKGIEKGKLEGKLEAKIEDALLFIQEYNIDVNEVSKKLKIPIEELEKCLRK